MSEVLVERRDGVVVITLSRPDRLNAVTAGVVAELHAALDALATDTETRVVVLTGAGRGFCAGMDIQGGGPDSADSAEDRGQGSRGDGGNPREENAPSGPREPDGRPQRIYRAIARGGEVVARLREIPQPVIAALHGPVAGMGISLALACDLRVADPTAKFVFPFLSIGLSGGDLGLSWLLPRVVGPGKAAELLYRSQTLTAEQADGLGMLTEISAEGADLDGALRLAGELLGASPYGLRHTKELLNLSLEASSLRAHLAAENRTQALAFLTEDFAEGIAARLERRPPEFRNR
jgi:enoyl-CoA hydratase